MPVDDVAAFSRIGPPHATAPAITVAIESGRAVPGTLVEVAAVAAAAPRTSGGAAGAPG